MAIFEHSSELAKLETEPACDWASAFLARPDKGQILLAYAVKRDFLSVPRTFNLVSFYGNQEFPAECHLMQHQDYFEQMEIDSAQVPPALYQLPSDDQGQLLLLVAGANVLEVAYVTLVQHPSVYHGSSAQQVLASYLSSLDPI